jgi:hypothetical protein
LSEREPIAAKSVIPLWLANLIGRRELRLTGGLTATVLYDGVGVGYETVYVDGTLAARPSNPSLTDAVPRIPFLIGSTPAEIEVGYGVMGFRHFRLWVGGELIFSEPPGTGLPVPSGAPCEPGGALPLPGEQCEER